MDCYFSKFEDRKPYNPIPYSAKREFIYQYLATINICLGIWYFWWRWTASLNPDAMFISILLALAETSAFIGTLFFIVNLWAYKDAPQQPPPKYIDECLPPEERLNGKHKISVDVFLPTYTEDPELVRLSIIDAKAINYPHPLDLKIHILDDGKRPEMKQVADEEGVNYLTRDGNEGYKAGNLKHGMEKTSGDFLVILDADTRPFPTFLEHTMGYFKDPDVAWVQTPQWFFDIPAGQRLNRLWQKRVGKLGYWIASAIEKIVGPIYVGKDIFGNDPRMFYDCILRKRMNYNAAFCCGAGSIHRREVVQRVALSRFADDVVSHAEALADDVAVDDEELKHALKDSAKKGMVFQTEITPYKYHVSEDIYTSLLIHADTQKTWKSVHHPRVESKMLSPQDILAWITQRFKYAGGTLDIIRRDNPLLKKGLTFMQKLMYISSIWSYFAAFWMIIFLSIPIIFFFTGIIPIKGFTTDFFVRILTFNFISQLTFFVGTWGVNTVRDTQFYVAFFPLNLKAIWTIMRGKNISFKVTPKTRQSQRFLKLVKPQLAFVILNIAGIIYCLVRIALGYEIDLLGFIVATFWALYNVSSLMVIIRAAVWQPEY